MDAHLYRPEWRGEDLGLPMGQGTLTALRTREEGGGAEGEGKERWEGERKRDAGKRWKFLINK